MSTKTPEQIAAEIVQEHGGHGAAAFANIIRAIEADRAQRSKMEQFGAAVYEIMDGEEWSSDTTQAIGDYAANVLGMPFSGPDELEGDGR